VSDRWGAVVTGGASGLGAATARRLAARGASVVVVDRDADGARRLAGELDGVAVAADVADEAAADAAAELLAGVAPVRVLVCCAGLQRGARVVGRRGSVDLGWFRQSVEVNLVGTFNWVRVVAAHMAGSDPDPTDGGRGVIVTTSSITAFDGVDGGVAYAAAKAGVAGMSRALAREIGSRNITVNCVAPGFIDTDMTKALTEQQVAALLQQIPAGRFGMPEDIAAAVAFLASDDAAYISEQALSDRYWRAPTC